MADSKLTNDHRPSPHPPRGGRTGHRRLPAWLRRPLAGGRERNEVRRLLRRLNLNSVCESARCPNLNECWSRRTATFMLMGDVCTRNCSFCAVASGQPAALSNDEGERIAEAATGLQLGHVVLTSVTRDDLPDGGAAHFAGVIRRIRQSLPNAGIEVLTPDFQGCAESLRTVLAAEPDVFNHNMETCERLTGKMRDRGSYQRSLEVLRRASELGGMRLKVKSGFMLGLGETDSEVFDLLRDLRNSGVSRLTIGQYLSPGENCAEVVEFVSPDKFKHWREAAEVEYGFAHVESGPLVRSSYMADRALECDRR